MVSESPDSQSPKRGQAGDASHPLGPRARAANSVPVRVGGGPVWQGFLDRFERAAGSQASVLLTGEPGVGKGWLARDLHRLGPRAAGPLVEVDLSEGSAGLVESLLFGHEAGAYTGAQGARLGAVRRAEGGTLVLKGVHELELSLQVKLLRLLQERVVEPLGSEETIPVDVRVVCTSAPDLPRRVSEGSFREDLYYRMAVVVLEVPPLRVRFHVPEAWLPELVASAARRVARDPRELDEKAVQLLAEHPWPGNVLELENTLERVLVLGGSDAGGQKVQPEELDFLPMGVGKDHASKIYAGRPGPGDSGRPLGGRPARAGPGGEPGKVAAAARALGLTRKAFAYRLSRFQDEQQNQPGPEGEAEDEPEDKD